MPENTKLSLDVAGGVNVNQAGIIHPSTSLVHCSSKPSKLME